jgi:hypothetical protein
MGSGRTVVLSTCAQVYATTSQRIQRRPTRMRDRTSALEHVDRRERQLHGL